MASPYAAVNYKLWFARWTSLSCAHVCFCACTCKCLDIYNPFIHCTLEISWLQPDLSLRFIVNCWAMLPVISSLGYMRCMQPDKNWMMIVSLSWRALGLILMFMCCHRTEPNHWLSSFTVDLLPNDACCCDISHTLPVIALDRSSAEQEQVANPWLVGDVKAAWRVTWLANHDFAITNASCKHEYTPETRTNIKAFMCTASRHIPQYHIDSEIIWISYVLHEKKNHLTYTHLGSDTLTPTSLQFKLVAME